MNNGIVLSIDDAVFIRRSIRNGSYGSIRKLAEILKADESTVLDAARGRTFRKANRLESPIEFSLENRSRTRQKTTPPDKFLDGLIALRKSDPKLWTFKKLKHHMEEISIYRLSQYHLSLKMVERDPTLSKKRPRTTINYRAFKHNCVICERDFTSKHENVDVCRRADCTSVVKKGETQGA